MSGSTNTEVGLIWMQFLHGNTVGRQYDIHTVPRY